MMPLSFNVTLMNPASLHAFFLSALYDLSDPKASECIAIKFRYPKMLWPHFGNV
jgi:hypothetical protein